MAQSGQSHTHVTSGLSFPGTVALEATWLKTICLWRVETHSWKLLFPYFSTGIWEFSRKSNYHFKNKN